jgi:hypothetical protein
LSHTTLTVFSRGSRFENNSSPYAHLPRTPSFFRTHLVPAYALIFLPPTGTAIQWVTELLICKVLPSPSTLCYRTRGGSAVLFLDLPYSVPGPDCRVLSLKSWQAWPLIWKSLLLCHTVPDTQILLRALLSPELNFSNDLASS